MFLLSRPTSDLLLLLLLPLPLPLPSPPSSLLSALLLLLLFLLSNLPSPLRCLETGLRFFPLLLPNRKLAGLLRVWDGLWSGVLSFGGFGIATTLTVVLSGTSSERLDEVVLFGGCWF